MDSRAFVQALVDEMEGLFAKLGEEEILEAESEGKKDVPTLLKLALKSELEAAEVAGYWMPQTHEVDGKTLFALQCGDEMRHYQMIAHRLRELGHDPEAVDLVAEGYSPLYQYLRGLRTTVERAAAGPFTCEAIARVRNDQFIAYCRSVGDEVTARLYEDVIQPEEVHHHEEGRRFLERHATSPEAQEAVAAAVRATLAIADELKTLAEKATGVDSLPVS
ncbi:MAG TPA: ferritin-like domain-containing protein [Thermoanaerobaculia bacterium]|nr:ferritin-like domain-containing protein [Thermoanaerobaculia bacterium]